MVQQAANMLQAKEAWLFAAESVMPAAWCPTMPLELYQDCDGDERTSILSSVAILRPEGAR